MSIKTKLRIRPIPTNTVKIRQNTAQTKRLFEIIVMNIIQRITGKNISDREESENITF